jgi:hypothetical protein
MFAIYVIWNLDGPSHMTRLDYEELIEQRQAMQGWSTRDYVAQAFDAEYPGEKNLIAEGHPFECQAILEATELRVVF